MVKIGFYILVTTGVNAVVVTMLGKVIIVGIVTVVETVVVAIVRNISIKSNQKLSESGGETHTRNCHCNGIRY